MPPSIITFEEICKLATEKGYSVHTTSVHTQYWVKQDEWGNVLFLTLDKRTPDQVTLERYVGIIQCKIGPFSFPHKLFEVWERQLLDLAPPMAVG